MSDENPYDSPDELSRDQSADIALWNASKCGLRGMAIGIAIPIALFAYGMVREFSAFSQLEPGAPRSGTGIAMQLVALVNGIPLGAVVGFVLGRALATVQNALSSKR